MKPARIERAVTDLHSLSVSLYSLCFLPGPERRRQRQRGNAVGNFFSDTNTHFNERGALPPVTGIRPGLEVRAVPRLSRALHQTRFIHEARDNLLLRLDLRLEKRVRSWTRTCPFPH